MQQYGGTDPEKEELYQMLRQQYDQLGSGQNMEEASEQARQTRLMAGLAAAGDRIGSAIAGTQHNAQPYNQLMQNANDPIKEAEAAQQKRLLLAKALYDKRHQSDMLAYNLEKDRKQMELLAGKQGYEREQDSIKNRLAQDRLELDRRKLEQSQTGSEGLTEAQKYADREFGKEYTDYVAKGGFADTQKQLSQLKDARSKLAESSTASGGIVGALPDFIRKRVTPEGFAIQESIEEVVQRNLREVLGAQFTEKEGERLISRAFNPSLSEEENLRRLDRLIAQIEDAAMAKREAVDYFEKNGTLKGFAGKLYNSAEDFLVDGPARSGDDGTAYAQEGKKIARKQYSPSRNQTKIIYSDGTEEIVDGKR